MVIIAEWACWFLIKDIYHPQQRIWLDMLLQLSGLDTQVWCMTSFFWSILLSYEAWSLSLSFVMVQWAAVSAHHTPSFGVTLSQTASGQVLEGERGVTYQQLKFLEMHCLCARLTSFSVFCHLLLWVHYTCSFVVQRKQAGIALPLFVFSTGHLHSVKICCKLRVLFCFLRVFLPRIFKERVHPQWDWSYGQVILNPSN